MKVDDTGDPPLGSQSVGVTEAAAADGGHTPIEDGPVKDRIWFTREWLDSLNLDSKSCTIISIKGEAMGPTLPDGCLIMVDRARRDLRDRQIFVLQSDDGPIARRAVKNGDGWQLVSDVPIRPVIDWSPEYEIVGQVVWMARTLI